MKALYRVFNRITNKKNIIFSMQASQQKAILERIGVASDNYDRSFKQYYCQMKLYGKVYCAIYNIMSFFPLVYYMICLSFSKPVLKNDRKIHQKTAVFYLEGKDKGIIQDSLLNEFDGKIFLDNANARYLDKNGKEIWKSLVKKYGFRPYFLLKILLKLSLYSSLINEYSCDAIVVCSEFSFASPVATEYCRSRQKELINIMHGEKLFCIRDAYTCFDRFYVWDELYADLFKKLNADGNQFIVERPKMFNVDKNHFIGHKHFCTYYLADESHEELERIIHVLNAIKNTDKEVAVRIHPRAIDRESVEKMLLGFIIEDNKAVSIDESICSTEYAISLYSTVLNQSFYNGVKIIIDDISKPEKYERLKSLEYIMLEKDVTMMSEFLKKNSISC